MSGFACLECGHKFRTVKAAERASFGDAGCPKCGGSDIDLAPTASETVRKMGAAAVAGAGERVAQMKGGT